MMRATAYLLAFLFTLTFTSCRNDRQFRIGVSQCSRDDWRTKMNDEILREIMFHPEATVEIRSADDSNEKQIADIRYFKDNGFDIIIAAPNEADAITPIIKEVYESGTPVILFDRNINGDYYTAFQGADNEALGEAAANYAGSLFEHGAKVLEIAGLAGSTPATGRHKGFGEAARSEGLEILASAHGNWNYEDAKIATDSLLNLYPETELIYAHNDRMAIGAADVARHKGLDIKIIGIDAAPEIGIKAVSDSVIDATFLYPTEGYRLIRTALSVLRGDSFDREVYLPVSSPVDLSNADILLLQNETLKEETAKIKMLKTQVDDYWHRHSAQSSFVYALFVVFVLVLVVLFLVLRGFWQRRRNQALLEEQNSRLERQRDSLKNLNEQLKSATQTKLLFFTNVSHDLRTPLSLIAEPIEQLASAENLTLRQKALVRIANKNVRILRRLINQILDFRKYENGKLDILLTEVSFADLVADWCEAFTTVAQNRDIDLTTDIRLPEGFTLAVDVERIERVFFNLLSNAFKYTPDNGKIHVEAYTADSSLVFSIKDTGRGIAEENIGNIFDRFYQVDKVHTNGSGIGLSLAKAFVELHGGSISVTSRVGVGSEFTVSLPVKHVAESADASVRPNITKEDVDTELGAIETGIPTPDPSKPLLLVIDDNEDIRTMAGELLSDDYSMIFASNGKDGVRAAAKYVPDLVICDVMMPVMDGLECCRRIKEEVSTSHVPVLMLTACSMDEQRVQGYESGADGYVSKPFSTEVLKSRIRNLIENRIRIRNLWESKSALPAPDTGSAKAAVGEAENEFYARFLEIVSSEMGDAALNVDTLASKMGLGRSQFYRKIKALTNYTPVELLRNLRLKRSRDLLTTTQKSISEIAYEVGFSTPAYFTRCYKEYYGETPSELRDRIGAK